MDPQAREPYLKRAATAGALLALFTIPSHAGSELFREVTLEAAGGILLPQGNLDGVLDPAPAMEMRFGTSYYRDFRAHAFAGYSPTGAGGIGVAFQAVGIGLDWGRASAWVPRPMGGVAMYVARIAKDEDPEDRYILLQGGESEFGAYAGLRWEWNVARSWQLSGSGRWDVVFTRPDYSHLATLQCGAGWRWP